MRFAEGGTNCSTNCIVFGEWNNPATWQITEQDKLRSREGETPSDFFVNVHEDFEACRKWAIKEIMKRRKLLGRTMNDWLRRTPRIP